MRTVIYARFSSDNQNPRSIEDQVALCRERAAREGWPVVAVFEDRATSGAAGIGEDQRPGLNALLKLVEAGGVDQVLAESTDRVSRHVADAHLIRERIEFASARLFTLFDGAVTPMVSLIKGFTDAQFRTDLAARVRRGQRGSVAQGRSPANVSYGYRIANRIDERGRLIAGLREIEPEAAETVLRIFREYAAGRSALGIASGLNADGIAPPGGGALWRASTVLGQEKNGSGMLRNRLYVGELVYGRTRTVTNPVTRRKLMRPNTGEQPISEQAVPHLRIVDDALWVAVQAQIAARRGQRPERQRRPKHLLSGLGECGVCGGTWTKVTGDHWGCARFRAGRACTNNRMIATHLYEKRVLADLKGNMLAPDAVAAYVREYHLDHARQSRAIERDRSRLARQLADATRKMERIVAAFAAGGNEFAEIREMLAAARGDKERLARELASVEALPKVLTLHTNLAEQYRREVEDLELALAMPGAELEAIPAARAMIAKVIARPSARKRGVDLEVVRQLDQILSLALGEVREAQPR